MYDVLIVGGGLMGSYTAGRLAQLGHKVLVLERNKKLTGKASCTGIISKECADTFDIDKRFILKNVNSARLFSPAGKMLHLRREETQAYIIDRKALDVSLAQRAQQAGVEYVLDSPVNNIEIRSDRVRVCILCGTKEAIFEAGAVVIAGGFALGLTEKLGMGRPSDFALGAQVEVSAPEVDEVEVYFGRGIAPGFFAWLVPVSPGKARVGMLARRTPALYLKRFMESLIKQGKIAGIETRINHGVVPLKPLPRTYGERVLVIGDASGQVKPTTGGGIYYGLLGANFAVENLHGALKSGDLSAQKLARYERQWGRKLKSELRTGYWARKLWEHLDDNQIDRLFDIMIKTGIDTELSQAKDVSFDWHKKTVLRLVGHSMVAGALGVVKLPLRLPKV